MSRQIRLKDVAVVKRGQLIPKPHYQNVLQRVGAQKSRRVRILTSALWPSRPRWWSPRSLRASKRGRRERPVAGPGQVWSKCHDEVTARPAGVEARWYEGVL